MKKVYVITLRQVANGVEQLADVTICSDYSTAIDFFQSMKQQVSEYWCEDTPTAYRECSQEEIDNKQKSTYFHIWDSKDPQSDYDLLTLQIGDYI